MVLNDEDLLQAIQQQAPIVRGVSPQSPSGWYDKASPVQASSVDLRIGRIYIPGKAGDEEGSVDRPKKLHTLESGQTAIVLTEEVLHLPMDLAAIGFPPSHVSAQGLLMTNPGHVDPGFVGPMRFTVINMGRAKYVLKRGNPIVTLLFLQLSRACQRDWLARNDGHEANPPDQSAVDHLSEDFLDIKRSAEEIAKRQVEEAGLSLKKWGTIGAIALAIISVLSVAFGPKVLGISDLKTRMSAVEASLSVRSVQEQLDRINKRLTTVEKRQKEIGSERK